MRKTILLLPFLAATAGPAEAQDNTAGAMRGRRTTLGGGLEIGVPLGDFGDTWGRQIVGVGARMSMPMRLLPIDWGFGFGWGNMGGDSRQVDVSNPALTATRGNLSVRSNVYAYHGLLRFKPVNGKVSPYIDGLVGIRHFSTRTKLTVDGLSDPVSKERRASDFVGSTGWAVGVQVAPTGGALYLEGRVERLSGGRVTYVDPRTISIANDGTVTLGTLSSGSRVVNILLGVGLRF